MLKIEKITEYTPRTDILWGPQFVTKHLCLLWGVTPGLEILLHYAHERACGSIALKCHHTGDN